MSALTDLTLLVLPGIALVVAVFLLVRREADPMLRILLLILGFVPIRDAMTPVGLWEFGADGGAPWLRFVPDPAVLLSLAGATLALTGLLLWRCPDLRALVRRGRVGPLSVGAGLLGGVVAAAQFLLLSLGTPIQERGEIVPLGVLPATIAHGTAIFVLAAGLL